MLKMLELMGLDLEGRHHSGIDDARNLCRVVAKLCEEGFVFHEGMVSDL